jgi:hypothetical protein
MFIELVSFVVRDKVRLEGDKKESFNYVLSGASKKLDQFLQK